MILTQPTANRRYLLIVRAGDESLHRNWIAGPDERNFDLLVSYYGSRKDRFRQDGEFYHALTGPRWPAHHAILRGHPALRDIYSHICFACDDLDADTATWNALFASCDKHGFDLAQPAILGPVSYPITAPVPNLRYRITNFVENMCPVFARRALAVCGATFGDSVSGWGLNHVWCQRLTAQGCKLAIVDSICVTHTRALREGSLYTLLADTGVDPTAEMFAVMAREGIERTDIRELSRVHQTPLHAAARAPGLALEQPRIPATAQAAPLKRLGDLTRITRAATRRYLLIIRAGDESLHRNWIAKPADRNFDLLVSYYGSKKDRFREDGDFYHVLPGPQWPAHDAILRENPLLRHIYSHICFACDDLDADAATWSALFTFCDKHGFDLAQPAILGPVSYPITAPVQNLLYRVTNFVEVMCPVFSQRALSICGGTFGHSVSGWGLNHIWPKRLAAYGCTLAIIDSVRVTHTRALREGSLYTLLADAGVDPTAEMVSVMARDGIERTDMRELSRVHRTKLHAIAYRLSRIRLPRFNTAHRRRYAP